MIGLVKFHMTKIKSNWQQIKTSKVMDLYEYKQVGVIRFLILRRKGWAVNCVEYFIFSDVKNYWSRINDSDRITIISVLITIILFILEKINFTKLF